MGKKRSAPEKDCPQCGKRYHVKRKECPHCHTPNPSYVEKEAAREAQTIAVGDSGGKLEELSRMAEVRSLLLAILQKGVSPDQISALLALARENYNHVTLDLVRIEGELKGELK